MKCCNVTRLRVVIQERITLCYSQQKAHDMVFSRIRELPQKHPGVWCLIAVLIYTGLALFSTGQLREHPTELLPIGEPSVLTVPLFNAWTMWWNADRLTHGFQGYWNAPIFYPTSNTLAFSEPQPLTVLLAPVLWLTGSPVLVCNVYVWLSLVLNGVFAARLLRATGSSPRGALGGGMLVLILPIVHWQLDVAQVVPVWGMLWTWQAVRAAIAQPSWKSGAVAGLAWGISCLLSLHQGLLLTLALLLSLIALRPWTAGRHWWQALLSAAVVGAILVLPIAIPLQQTLERHQFQRPRALMEQLSARPEHSLPAVGWVGLRPPREAGPLTRPVTPGYLLTVCAAAGLGWGLWRRQTRVWTQFLAVTIVVATCLSWGPHLKFGNWTPWWILVDYVPGFGQLRNIYRFAYLVQLALVLLVPVGLHGLLVSLRYCRWGEFGRRLGVLLVGGLTLCMAVENWPADPPLKYVPLPEYHADWIAALRQETDPHSPIVCLPLPQGDRVEDYEGESLWMFFATFHERRLMNGYSGFFPETYFHFQSLLRDSFPQPEMLRHLTSLGVRTVVIDTGLTINHRHPPIVIPPPDPEAELWLEQVFVGKQGIAIYRIVERQED